MQRYLIKARTINSHVRNWKIEEEDDATVIVTADDTAPLIRKKSRKKSNYGSTVDHEGKEKR